MRTVVLDTNVLLSDPAVLLSYTDAEVVVPETVLGELDKLKTSRVDPDLRFRGREVSRVLFELSEQGSLIAGVDLPDGGRLRVVPLDAEGEFPDELSAKNADDRILAVALQICKSGCDDLVLVTNDLNMLLKAQALGVKVQRHFDGMETSFGRRYIIRPFQRYKIPLAILAIALAVFAAIFALLLYNPLSSERVGVPQEFRDQLMPSQQQVLDLLTRLQKDPKDEKAELALANLYFNLAETGHPTPYAQLAITHYRRVLELNPGNLDARTDMAILFPLVGDTDRAIQETMYVLTKDPNHIQANFNLGIFYWQDRRDYKAAEAQFKKVIELTQGRQEPDMQKAMKDAQTNLALVQKDAGRGATTPSSAATVTQ